MIRPDGEADEDRGRGQERIEAPARPPAVSLVRPRSRRSQAPPIDRPRSERLEDETAWRDPEDRRVVALEVAPRAGRARARSPARGGRSRPAATRMAPIDREVAGPGGHDRERGQEQPTSAAGTVTSRPSHSCAVSSWPPDAPRPRARASAGAAPADDEDADQADRCGRDGQRAEGRQRQGGLGRARWSR